MVSFIIPTYNEERRLEPTIQHLVEWLEKEKFDYEIIIADDDSNDGTRLLGEKFAEKNRRIKFLRNPQRKGKGWTIMHAIRTAKDPETVFLDADMATSLNALRPLIRAVQKEYVIATGSRYHREAKAERNILRNFTSRVYNFILRILFSSTITDHQCGFKAFKRERITPLFPKIQSAHWFWDTEVLVKAQRRGLGVIEIPVRWKETPGSKFRILRDGFGMVVGVVQLWMDVYVKRFY